ncbi:hypothetical protein [Romboutsia sp. 13368]|uniref:hypothetical protein n=1 Tax=Romboutsia sp. 13368 TaxID=2708053 RepID=UPI0025D7CE88|nr:hypothetical protein [Romboutsia sp. 13368]
MDINQQNNKIPELSAKVFTSSCKVVNIEDISHTKNINKYIPPKKLTYFLYNIYSV